MMRIAIATEQEYLEKGWKEDNVLRIKLISLLRNEGISFPESNVVIIDWRDRQINPHTFDAIFISSTWNAVDFPNEFLEWLKNCESDGIARLINCSEIIAKTFDKKNYFQELASIFDKQNLRGALIPTYFTSPAYQDFSISELRSFLKKSDFEAIEIVVKPRISADGKDVSRIKLDGRSDDVIEAELTQALKKTKVKASGGMIQPLISTIETGNDHGEYQLLFLNAKFSHAIVKPLGFGACASSKKFIKKEDLPDGMYEFAEFIADYFLKNYNVIRIRVDMLVDDKQRPVLLEAELIEPNSNTDSLYSFSLANIGKEDIYLPCEECQEYNDTMNRFAAVIYNEAKRLKNSQTIYLKDCI